MTYLKPVLALFLLCSTATANADIKRTASGKPDFSGTYDTATLTPLNRPKEFGDKQFMTREEADRLVKATLGRFSFAEGSSDPNRKAPKKGGDGNNTAGAGNVGGYNSFWIDPGDAAVEIDGKFRTSIIYDPVNGRQPALTPKAQARMATAFGSFAHDNDGTASWLAHEGPGPFDDPESLAPSERCLISFASTVPSLPSLYNNFRRIVQTDDHVLILNEMVHDTRMVRMGGEHLDVAHRSWLGDSVGSWDGDTLVVRTKHFRPRSGLGGADENLEVTERFNLREDGHIVYDFTVSNPGVWTSDWSGEYMWTASEDKVYEYACHEGNYAMEGILKGARLLESEWDGPTAGQ